MLEDCLPQKVDAEDAHLAIGQFVGVTCCGCVLPIGLIWFSVVAATVAKPSH